MKEKCRHDFLVADKVWDEAEMCTVYVMICRSCTMVRMIDLGEKVKIR